MIGSLRLFLALYSVEAFKPIGHKIKFVLELTNLNLPIAFVII